MTLVVKNPPTNAVDIRDASLIPGSGRFPGGGPGNPLQYSCLENPIDRWAWWTTVHGVAKSQTQLKWLSTTYRWFSSVQFSPSVVCDSLQPHELQHVRPPYASPTPRVYSDSRALSQWCHLTISSSVIPFCRLQSFPASGSLPVSQFFTSGGQSIGVSASASVLPMNILNWFPLESTGWISLQSKGLSRVFSNTTVQKHQFFSTQPSL